MIKHYWLTSVHKYWVMWYILKACWALLKRGFVHDFSKYELDEAFYFRRMKDLKDVEYASSEYDEQIRLLRPALDRHYRVNNHHPEYYRTGIKAMSPLDLVEMLCDWKAATRKHKTGDIWKSIKVNQERYNYDEDRKNSFGRDLLEMGL